MNKLRVLACVLCLLFLANLRAFADGAVDSTPLTQYRHRAWRASDGWFDSSILSMAQGADGYLWIGTQSGLLRFDGVRFSTWTPPQGHPTLERVRSLLAARNGELWLDSDAGLEVLKGNELIEVPLEGGSVQSVYEDHTGTIWVTRAGLKLGQLPLCNVSAHPVRCYGPADGLTIRYATRMAEDAEGFFWIGSGLLVRWKPGTSQVEYFGEELKAYGNRAGVGKLLLLSDGSLLAGLSAPGQKAGLQSLKDGKWESVQARGFDGGGSGVRNLFQDRDGGIWVAPAGAGLVHLKNAQADTFTRADGLSGDRITNILEDTEGTVWVATEHGLDNFSRMPILTYTAREGMPVGSASSVAARSDGTVFVATPQPVAMRNGVPVELPGLTGIANSGPFISLLVDSTQEIWLARGSQLLLYRDGKLSVVRTSSGADSLPFADTVTELAEDPQHTIWGLITGKDRRRLVTIAAEGMREVTDLPYADIGYLLAIDQSGRIWTAGGTTRLNRFQDGKIVTQPLTEVSEHFAAQDLFVDTDNQLWVVSTEGLKILRDGSARSIGNENGLPCRYFSTAIIDRDQTLWIAGRCGLLRIEQREWQRALDSPGAKIDFRQFGAAEGWITGSTQSDSRIAQSNDGKLWFAGADLRMLDPNKFAAESLAAPVHIEGIVADHKQYDLRAALHRIPSNPRELEIDYTAPSSLNPQAIQFKYRLTGHEETWQYPGTRRQAFYTDLKPGHYRFEVAVDDKRANAGQRLDDVEFVVLPAYYQTWWFRALCGGVCALALWVLYVVRLRRVTGLLRLRHQERMVERESVARDLHDTFFQAVQSLFLRFHTATRQLPEQEPSRLTLERALDDSDRVMLQGRQVMLDLRAESSKTMTLADALAVAGNELKADNPCELSVTVVGDQRLLFPLVFEELRRFGQEGLTNAFRHARAKLIEVEINYGRSELRVRVRDDGIGIEQEILKPGFRRGHWGLPGMRERAAKIGGRLNVWSRSGAGTEIELLLPASAAYSATEKRFGFGWLAGSRR